MIFVGLFFIGLAFYGFCSFWGLMFALVVEWQSRKFKAAQLTEPPSHVNLLTAPTPYDQAKDLVGWDGAEELDIEEEL